jgi:hypothetical protein
VTSLVLDDILKELNTFAGILIGIFAERVEGRVCPKQFGQLAELPLVETLR